MVLITIIGGAAVVAGAIFVRNTQVNANETQSMKTKVALPPVTHNSQISIEQALFQRRSVRDYTNEPLTTQEIAQILWAAQGITHPDGYRTAPSAGALYPLEIYLVAGHVKELPAGVYRYEPVVNSLERWLAGDIRTDLYNAALQQDCIKDAAAIVVIAAVYERTTQKYGDRGTRYVHMEVGHAAQNIYLQVVSLKLGTVFIGAFYDEPVHQILQLEHNVVPLGLMPIGKISAE